MAGDWWEPKPIPDAPPRPKPHRSWAAKLREAYRGVKRGVRGHSSFFVHFFFAALAVAAAAVLECDALEWCLVIGCIGAVLAMELMNSALETLFHGLDEESKGRIVGCLDIAAGAVLVAGLTAALIGTIVFARRVLLMLHWLPD